MRVILITAALLIGAPGGEKVAPSGGITQGSTACQERSYTAGEHRQWSQRFIRKGRVSRKAKRRHRYMMRCAASSRDRVKMKKRWKRVLRADLPANHNLWIRIGKCEQPGPGYRGIYWSHPGPTYQGGLGFWHGTWDSFRYPGMPGNAGDATWREQMRVANRLLRKYGTSPWGCA